MMAKVAELTLLPSRPARHHYRYSGLTIGQKWEQMSTPARREFLYRAGVNLWVWKEGENPEAPGIALAFGDAERLVRIAGGIAEDAARVPRAGDFVTRNLSRPMLLEALRDKRLTQSIPVRLQ